MVKIARYHFLRSQGIRLYGSKSWRSITPTKLAGQRSMSVNATQKVGPSREGSMSVNATQKVGPSREVYVSPLNQMLEKLGFKGALRNYPQVLQYSGYRLYISVSEAMHYNNIYKQIDLPDTFQTWHRLTSLHIWLISTRLYLEGRDGKVARQWMCAGFNNDISKKSKAVMKAIKAKEPLNPDDIETLHDQFILGLMNYDEGILGDDRHLAAAIWRNLYGYRADVDPCHLETMVKYIRKQVKGLQAISTEDILTNGLIPFYPVSGNKIPQETYDALAKAAKKKIQFSGVL